MVIRERTRRKREGAVGRAWSWNCGGEADRVVVVGLREAAGVPRGWPVLEI